MMTPYEIALEELGVAEIPGPETNARIAEYHATTGTEPNDETPWCSSFRNWCEVEAGGIGTGKPNARSWLDWGEPVDTPIEGDTVVLWRGSRNGWQGHVGFFVRYSDDGSAVRVLGGNQGDRVSMAWYPRERVLGFRGVM